MLYSAHFLTCPICRCSLTQTQAMLKCPHNHTFDIAKEGYVNLLRKPLPGDTREMLQARRAFLEHSFYQPLSTAINELVTTHLPAQLPALYVLDAGCGEGYYLGRLLHMLGKQHYYLGIDIAKDAVRLAAKRYHQALFVAANLKEPLPLSDQSIHVLLNIFAPRNPAEFARVLAPGGLLLVAIPNSDHLQQLRAALHLLAIEENKQQHILEQFSSDFSLITSAQVRYTIHLMRKEIEQVVLMTPNYWHRSDETRAAMERLQEIETTVSFTCLAFSRRMESSAA